MRTLRALLFQLWLYGSMAVIGIVCLPLLLGPKRWAFIPARLWARSVVSGLRVLVGARSVIREQARIADATPRLLALKHQAMWDVIVPFLVCERPCFVLKKELMAMPVFGFYAKAMDMIPIDREAGASALKAMVAAGRAAVADGRSIVIFPEGTRQLPDAPPDYKPGVAALYRELGVPASPGALNSGLCWPAKGSDFRPGVIVWEVLPEIEPGLPRKAFMQRLEAAIEPATDRLVAEGRAAQAALAAGDARPQIEGRAL